MLLRLYRSLGICMFCRLIAHAKSEWPQCIGSSACMQEMFCSSASGHSQTRQSCLQQ